MSSVLLGAVLIIPNAAVAAEGGVSLWLPGFFGSLAASPLEPGWSLASIYYHTSVDAGGDVAFARQVTRGNITVNFNGNIRAVLNADADIGFVSPSYTFVQKIFGGQLNVATVVAYGHSVGSVDTTLTGNGPLGLTLSRGSSDAVTAWGDGSAARQLALEPGRPQLHGLFAGQFAGRGLRGAAAGQSRHWSRRVG